MNSPLADIPQSVPRCLLFISTFFTTGNGPLCHPAGPQSVAAADWLIASPDRQSPAPALRMRTSAASLAAAT